MYLWKKKFGDVHIANGSVTYCNRPMLGNNYANQSTSKADCKDCLKAFEQENKNNNKTK